MVIVRRLLWALLLATLVMLASVFAYMNPGHVDVDVGFARFEQVSMTAFFSLVFALGWLVGLVTAAAALLRSANDKRRLRQDLQYAEAELQTLRKTH